MVCVSMLMLLWAASGAALRPPSRIVIFDADGTLLDSLPPHIDFCHTMNEELNLGLMLPARTQVANCRSVAAAPMANFFRSAGFPESSIAQCVAAYEARFSSECPVLPFAGIDHLLHRLTEEDSGPIPCGIVSSNTAANVLAGLGEGLASRFAFVDGIDNAPADKAEALSLALSRLGIEPAAAVYVGDTRKDWIKARAAGLQFVGVSYGFEDLAPEALDGAPVAHTVEELSELLLAEPTV